MMDRRKVVAVILGIILVVVFVATAAGNVFYGRPPFCIRVPWGDNVKYLGGMQTDKEFRFVVFSTGADRKVFGALIEGMYFGKSFEKQRDEDIVQAVFTIKRKNHIEEHDLARYTPISSFETHIAGYYAIKEEFIELTSKGLQMRGFQFVFGDRHICYYGLMSSESDDFPFCKDRMQAILTGISVINSYPTFVKNLPLTIDIGSQKIPVVLLDVQTKSNTAVLGWKGVDISLSAIVSKIEGDSDVQAVVQALAKRVMNLVGGHDGKLVWRYSVLSVNGVSIEVKEARKTEGGEDWEYAIASWDTTSLASVVLYKRIAFKYNHNDLRQIIAPFLPKENR